MKQNHLQRLKKNFKKIPTPTTYEDATVQNDLHTDLLKMSERSDPALEKKRKTPFSHQWPESQSRRPCEVYKVDAWLEVSEKKNQKKFDFFNYINYV